MTRLGVKLVLAAALSCALALGGCGQKGGASSGSAPDVLNFSILSAEDQQSMSGYWQPLLDDMEKATGLKVKAFYSSNYTTLIQAMAFKQVQLGWFSAQPAVEAIQRANGEVFARTIVQGNATYKSVVIVRKDSGITLDRLLKCDKTLSFGLGDPQSTSGTLAPMTYLFGPRRIDPNACFRQVRSASHQANMLSVANGVLDAATNNTTGLLFYRTGTPEAQAAVARTEVIWTSPALPESAVVYRKDLDPAVKQKVRAFFLNYGKAPGAQGEHERAVLAKLKYSSFDAADDAYLAPILQMQKAQKAAVAATLPTKAS